VKRHSESDPGLLSSNAYLDSGFGVTLRVRDREPAGPLELVPLGHWNGLCSMSLSDASLEIISTPAVIERVLGCRHQSDIARSRSRTRKTIRTGPFGPQQWKLKSLQISIRSSTHYIQYIQHYTYQCGTSLICSQQGHVLHLMFMFTAQSVHVLLSVIVPRDRRRGSVVEPFVDSLAIQHISNLVHSRIAH